MNVGFVPPGPPEDSYFPNDGRVTNTIFIGGKEYFTLIGGVVAPFGFRITARLEEGVWEGTLNGKETIIKRIDSVPVRWTIEIDGEVIDKDDFPVWNSPMYQSLRSQFHDVQDRMAKLERKFVKLYYSPGMPGYQLAEAGFEDNLKKSIVGKSEQESNSE